MTGTTPTIPEIRIFKDAAHPWFLWKEVDKPAVRVPPGSVVDIHERGGKWVGRGFYNGHARIRLRVLTRNAAETVDRSFFESRLERAVEWRKQLSLDSITNAYRVVHSEGDALGGLVVDRYADLLVIEYFSAGMFRFRQTIREVLASHFPGSSFYEFAEKHVQKQESFDCHETEAPTPRIVEEGGVKFQVAPGSMHKTGFFTDQRDNRRRVAEWSQGKSVLDLCCHSGGFAIAALKKGATRAIGVDRDADALTIAATNAELNGVTAEWTAVDLMEFLPRTKEKFDVVVLDPPKQTRSREGLPDAMARYFDMNRMALRAVAPGGILFTCSCTGLIKESQFLEIFAKAAKASGRQVQVFQISGAGADHPFLIDVPEGRYLKAIAARVI